jgi:hypothetical protein
MNNIQFHIGEVVAEPRVKTYEYSDKNNFQIFVKTYTDYYNQEEIRAIPLNSNIKQIPRVGEHVLLVSGLDVENDSQTMYTKWYYVSTFSVLSDVNSDFLQGVAKYTNTYTPPSSFIEREVSFLQPYEGDSIFEGRFGNTIRLGSTIVGGQYQNPTSWKGLNSGDPIIVISNGAPYKKNSYIVENPETDQSSLYLTSTQNIPSLLLGDKNSRNPLNCFLPNESKFSKSQFIGVADRIILKAKTDVAVIDSPTAIILNTTGDVRIGSDEADQSMVHGDVLLNIIQLLITQMLSGVQIGDTYAPSGGYANSGTYAQQAQTLLKDLLSSTYFIKKNTY